MTNKSFRASLCTAAPARCAARDYSRELAHMRGLDRGRPRPPERRRCGAGRGRRDRRGAGGLGPLRRRPRRLAQHRRRATSSTPRSWTGPRRRAGAVAALEGFASPIRAARAVMEKTPHVMLAGEGAAAFAASRAWRRSPTRSLVHAGAARRRQARAELAPARSAAWRSTQTGALAAATSTGGMFGKLYGRVGDSPITGRRRAGPTSCVAVSCTGAGEMLHPRRRRRPDRLPLAPRPARAWPRRPPRALDDVRGAGRRRRPDRARRRPARSPCRSTRQGMKRAALHADGRITSEVF